MRVYQYNIGLFVCVCVHGCVCVCASVCVRVCVCSIHDIRICIQSTFVHIVLVTHQRPIHDNVVSMSRPSKAVHLAFTHVIDIVYGVMLVSPHVEGFFM